MNIDPYKHILSELNWLAVVVSALAFFVLGALWYSPVLFGKAWMKLLHIEMTEEGKKEARKKMPLLMAVTVVLSFIMAVVIALLILGLHGDGHPRRAMVIGAMVSTGIGLTSMGLNNMYENKPRMLLLINWGYNLVGCVIIALILALWK